MLIPIIPSINPTAGIKNPKIIDKIDELGLAIWIQDDGYRTKYGSYSISCGKTDINILYDMAQKLNKKFKLNFKVRKASRENVIELNKKESYRLVEIIKPYIHPVMSYKIDRKILQFPKIKDEENKISLCETTIYHKEEFEYYDAKYDIEVEGNHNYFAQGMLVSNSFLKDVDLFGVNYGYWQYSYMQPSYMPRWFDQKEIIYSCLNPRSEHTYGWAPIQSIMEVVESLNNSIRWNRDFFYNSAIPAGIVDFGNMDEDTLKAVKAEWQQGLKGKAHKLLMVSNPNPSYSEGTATQSKSVTFTAFQKGAREMEFLESQKWYSSLVTSAFKCSPAELGILGDVKNKAIQEGQERVHVRRAIKPILAEIEYKFNTQLITEFFNQDDPRGKTGGLRFEFDYIDPVDEAKQKENEIKDLEAGVITVNEVRLSRGMEPVDWGDEPMSMNNQPEFDEEDPFDKEVKQEGAEKKDKDDNPNAKKVKKAASFDSNTGGEGTPGSAFNQTTPEKKKIKDEKKPLEVIDTEYKGYSDYLEGVFKKCKKKIKKYVETELKEETFCKGMTISADKGKSLKKSYTFNKSFSGFLSKMINTLFKTTFSDKFYNDIEKYIKKDLKIGIKDAEEALQKEIIVKDIDTQALLLTDQQIQGYTLWNGNKFVGIKGAVDSVQKQIINNLNQAIGKEDVSMDDLTKAVDDAWTGNDGIDEYRTLRIARTETSRIINKGKLQGAHDSGLEVKKKWVGYPGMCPICEELSKQAPIELDEWFVHGDDKVQHPPIHPNDRCGIELVNK